MRVTISRHEVRLLELAAAGTSNKDIGGQLFLAEDTVKSQLRRLYAKLGARNRAHAVAIAFRRGWLR